MDISISVKLKFYLRGLGIGILVTAVIMGIASSRDRQMTDDEIKARAKELGMVESVVLSGMASASPQGSNAAPSQAPENTAGNGQAPAESSSPENSSETPEPTVSLTPENTPEVSQPTVSPTPENSPQEETPTVLPSPENSPVVSPSPVSSPEPSAPAVSPSPENEPEAGARETVTITIRSGQSSVAVSKMLEEAGLVESASAYDKFLCENGYDKRLKTGSHEIPVGATEEEIARIITSRE